MEPFTFLHLSPEQYRTTRWSGGSTTQILICPPEADYAGRDFLWRVSSALVEDETSTFTPLPDYARQIATLEGSIVLRHDGGAPVPLAPYQVHHFDGAAATVSEGRCRDFNLMLRKNQAAGLLKAVCLAAGEVLTFSVEEGTAEMLIYCTEGNCTVTADGRAMSLRENEAALLRRTAEGSREAAPPVPAVTLRASCGCRLMLAQMRRLTA